MKEKKSTIKWICLRMRHFAPYIALISVLDIFLSVSMILLARISKDVIDYGTKSILNKLVLCAVALFAVIIFQVLIDAVISMLTVRVVGKLTISLRSYMFTTIVRKKYSKLFNHHSGDLLNRFTSDIDQVVSGSVNFIPNICSMGAKIIAGIGALILQNYIFAIGVLLVGFVLPLLGRKISRKYKYMHKEVQKTEGQARSFLQESFENIVVIKTFVSELPILAKLNEYMDKNLKLKIRRNFISVTISTLLYLFFTLGYYGVLVWGSVQISASLITYGTLNYYLQLISILRNPLQNISGIIPQYLSTVASAERLMEFENIDNEPDVIVNDELEKLKTDFEKIEIKNLAFAYDDELILKNCTFDINKNCITAITGESGSGKSTLFKIILGLYEPTGGTITLNGNVPIDASTRGLFSYVPQGNMILSGTIRDNITLCDNSVSDESVIKATKAAAIYDFITTLPDGFNTKLSERGAGLSEGQIQRLSIARALLFGAPILLLDESTSALDEQTETQVLSNIKSMTDKTVLFITHRNTSISVCDHIVHVDDKKFTVVK